MNPVEFCATECTHQRSGEMSVWWMYRAWLVTRQHINKDMILALGALVEPEKNAGGFRRTPVTINHVAIPAENIDRQIANLVNADLSPLAFYTEFEQIHPFVDGNGRVGALLYNLLAGTIDDPVLPPDVFAKK